MTEPVIKAENLGKKYTIGHQAERGSYTSIRDVLMQNAEAIWRKTKDLVTGKPVIQGEKLEEVWALKDVNFEIKRGEAVGIIGRNGAGKSTLLKILSRITEPTSGRASIKGRVASLLEVGTGFHLELTGRENIYLNGTILGMTRSEIRQKFDEIVAFAEVEKFLDTPVKRYSSGMYVRLAFAVAAHLEPEILVVDEVLAVGDSQFQKKCLGKMENVSQEGRTVLFVSHNMAAVQQLCQSGMVLTGGKLNMHAPIEEAVSSYIKSMEITLLSSDLSKRTDRKGLQWLKFKRVTVYNDDGLELNQLISGQNVHIRFYYTSKREKKSATVHVAFNVRNSQGFPLTNLNSLDSGQSRLDVYSDGYFECFWPKFNLRSGSYFCNLFCSVNGEIVDWIQNAFNIHVEDGDYYGSGKLTGREQGDILINHSWLSGASILDGNNKDGY